MYIETANSSLIIIFMRMDVSSGTEKTTLRRNGRCGQPAYISISIAWIGANTILFHRNKQGVSKQKIGHQTIRKPSSDSAGIDRGLQKAEYRKKNGTNMHETEERPIHLDKQDSIALFRFPGKETRKWLDTLTFGSYNGM